MASSYPAVATGLYNASTGVMSGRIFEGKAPAGTAYEFGVFNQQAGSPVVRTFGAHQVLDSGFIQLRVYARTPEAAQAGLAAWLAILPNVSVSGFTKSWLEREYDLPANDQLQADGYIFGRGALVSYKMES